MATFLIFIAVIAATVAVMYVMIKLLMMLDRGGKDEVRHDAAPPAKAQPARK